MEIKNIGKIASEAFAAARKRVLDEGLPVVESKDGILYEIFPNGERRVLKEIEGKTINVLRGTILEIK